MIRRVSSFIVEWVVNGEKVIKTHNSIPEVQRFCEDTWSITKFQVIFEGSDICLTDKKGDIFAVVGKIIFKQMRDFEIDDFVEIDGQYTRLTVDNINEDGYLPIKLDIDTFSKIGFTVSIVDNIASYLIRYEDLMLTPAFNPDTKDIEGFAVLAGVHYDDLTKHSVMEVVNFIRPIKYVHELQHLLRLGEYEQLEECINLN